MKIFHDAILPLGFKANGVFSGLKKSAKPDLAAFFSSRPAKASCLFTSNSIAAAPVKLCKRLLKQNKRFRAIIVNSANANCFTGSLGLIDAEQMSESLANALGIGKNSVLVASTGIIGRRLAIGKIKKAMPELVTGLCEQGVHRAKRAILTTDTFSKEISVKINISATPVTICGIAKGAGMIAPDMATMLCFLLTDANISQGALDKALKEAVAFSFNCISVDGCMSTNDSVMLLANGSAGNPLIKTGKSFALFQGALKAACLELAKMIIKDAEGATKFIWIKVNKARSFCEAKTVALAIANSNLFKAAMYGENLNFGRIAAAAGATGIDVKEEKLKIKVSRLNKKNIFVDVSLGRGEQSAVVYTSDLTPEYIRINAEYN